MVCWALKMTRYTSINVIRMSINVTKFPQISREKLEKQQYYATLTSMKSDETTQILQDLAQGDPLLEKEQQDANEDSAPDFEQLVHPDFRDHDVAALTARQRTPEGPISLVSRKSIAPRMLWERIASWVVMGASIPDIARQLGRPHKTISDTINHPSFTRFLDEAKHHRDAMDHDISGDLKKKMVRVLMILDELLDNKELDVKEKLAVIDRVILYTRNETPRTLPGHINIAGNVTFEQRLQLADKGLYYDDTTGTIKSGKEPPCPTTQQEKTPIPQNTSSNTSS